MRSNYLTICFILIGLSLNGFSQYQTKKSVNSVHRSTMSSDDVILLGYNIYRNNEKINSELLDEMQYQDIVPDNGAYNYYVTAVYEEGESGSSNIVEVLIDQNAINRDYVVFEEGTGTWCQYCPAAANGFADLVDQGKKVVGIAYHNGDSYDNSDATARLNYYGMTSFPSAVFDGVEAVGGGGYANQSMYENYLPAYDKRIEIPTAFSMGAIGTYSESNYEASVTIEKVALNNSSNLVLIAVIIENHISESWQGMTEVSEVARKLLPDANGTKLDFSIETKQIVNLDFVLANSWNMDNCKVIAFVQDINTKEIHQATEINIDEFVEETAYLKTASLETLFAPFDLTTEYSMVSPTVDLSWKAPGNSRWMQWDDGINASAIGSDQSPLKFDVAARWDLNDLTPLEGMVISKIAFFAAEATCDYSVRIWDGETDDNIIVDSLLESFDSGKWNEIELENPILIDIKKELWVGYYNDNSGNKYSAGCDAGPAVVGKGDKIRMKDGEWEDVSSYGIDANWNIKVYVEPYVAPDDTTSIIEDQKPQLIVFPNPASGNATIASDNTIQALYIISVNGQIVNSINPTSKTCTIDISEYNSGIYFVKIVTNKGYNFQKLVVE